MHQINKENKAIWNTNADYWDSHMGEAGNHWHQQLIAPATVRLLGLSPPAHLLDIACGNGLFARRMQTKGVQVTAFDFAEANIKHAKKYPHEGIDYRILDATDYAALVQLGKQKFDAAVANMALMDMPEIEPLFRALSELLVPSGCFVFSVSHPCFHTQNTEKLEDAILVKDYATTQTMKGEAIYDQPELQYFFERSISSYLQTAFQYGFVVDGIEEPVFEIPRKDIFTKIPPVLILRLRSLQR